MSEQNIHEKPQLVDTGRGFSVLYNGTHLYSKYNPKKNILTQIDRLTIEESTLIICFSPVLGYGLSELLEKLPNSSFVLGLEYDQSLMRFSSEHIPSNVLDDSRFSYIRTNTVSQVLKKIEQLPLFPFKKSITITCSAGIKTNPVFYENVQKYTNELLSRFWINRLTLIQLGRNYAHNIFRNLISYFESPNFYFLTGKERINKPILVVAAGPSLDTSREFIIQNREQFFLLAVDAAATALLPEITPDGIVIVESQYWIDDAFIGIKKNDIPLFADITASPRVLRGIKSPVYLFCTLYTSAFFLQNLISQLRLLVLEPLGSVGLTALTLSLQLSDTPVFHTGLDFSWGGGFTHARESSPIKKLYAHTARTIPLCHSQLSLSTHTITGKNDTQLRTSRNLTGYAELYRHVFAHNKRIVDIGTQGCLLHKNVYSYNTVLTLLQNTPVLDTPLFDGINNQTQEEQNKALSQYLKQEKTDLTLLLHHLTGESSISENTFEEILEKKEYLYTHFADAAHGYSLDISFLKRVRIELSYFLKILETF